MSFIGNIAAAQTAKRIGKYNAAVYNEQYKFEHAKAKAKQKVYDQVIRPKLIDDQNFAYSQFFVSALNTGAEFRPGETTWLVGLRNKQRQALELSMADYNKEVDRIDDINRALLIKAKGEGELYKGLMTARTEYFKAAGSLLTMGYKSYDAGQMVL
jgi:hypothetical protein|tara:strand:+ start:34 stop:501 length:468 start_codon:yes stop_codon:yes gene_type:complete